MPAEASAFSHHRMDRISPQQQQHRQEHQLLLLLPPGLCPAPALTAAAAPRPLPLLPQPLPQLVGHLALSSHQHQQVVQHRNRHNPDLQQQQGDHPHLLLGVRATQQEQQQVVVVVMGSHMGGNLMGCHMHKKGVHKGVLHMEVVRPTGAGMGGRVVEGMAGKWGVMGGTMQVEGVTLHSMDPPIMDRGALGVIGGKADQGVQVGDTMLKVGQTAQGVMKPGGIIGARGVHHIGARLIPGVMSIEVVRGVMGRSKEQGVRSSRRRWGGEVVVCR